MFRLTQNKSRPFCSVSTIRFLSSRSTVWSFSGTDNTFLFQLPSSSDQTFLRVETFWRWLVVVSTPTNFRVELFWLRLIVVFSATTFFVSKTLWQWLVVDFLFPQFEHFLTMIAFHYHYSRVEQFWRWLVVAFFPIRTFLTMGFFFSKHRWQWLVFDLLLSPS